MEGVEHLGQYVFEMTQAKVEMLKRGQNVFPPQDNGAGLIEDEEINGVVEAKGEEGPFDDDEMDGDGGEVKEEEEPGESDLDEIT